MNKAVRAIMITVIIIGSAALIWGILSDSYFWKVTVMGGEPPYASQGETYAAGATEVPELPQFLRRSENDEANVSTPAHNQAKDIVEGVAGAQGGPVVAPDIGETGDGAQAGMNDETVALQAETAQGDEAATAQPTQGAGYEAPSMPADTATPAPVAAAAPMPVATTAPVFAATPTPRPVATAAPIPVVIATPMPMPTATPRPLPTATPAPAPLDLDEVRNEFFKLLNAYRAEKGLHAVSVSTSTLRSLADMRAVEIQSNFAHRPNDDDSIFEAIGENIFRSSSGYASAKEAAEEIFNSWKNSPGHNAQLLSKREPWAALGVYTLNHMTWAVYLASDWDDAKLQEMIDNWDNQDYWDNQYTW